MGWPLNTNDLRKLNFPIGEAIPKRKHHRMDRSPYDYRREHQGLAHDFSRVHDRSKNPELITDRTALHSRQSWGGTVPNS